mgnify:FL=1
MMGIGDWELGIGNIDRETMTLIQATRSVEMPTSGTGQRYCVHDDPRWFVGLLVEARRFGVLCLDHLTSLLNTPMLACTLLSNHIRYLIPVLCMAMVVLVRPRRTGYVL